MTSNPEPSYLGPEQPARPSETGWEPGPSPGAFGQQSGFQTRQLTPSPAVDIVENADDIWVFVDLPGFKEEEIRIRSDQNTLVVTAERASETEEGRHVVLNERMTRVERSIPIPVSIRTNGARATYEDGTCKIVLPKAETDLYEEIEFTSE